MKVVILCGGKGTRLREETEYRPKPMVPIGGKPILWHIMKSYAHYGHKDFVLCLGYKGEMIKDYFRNYAWNTSDLTISLKNSSHPTFHSVNEESDWTVTLADTGPETMTAYRVRQIQKYIPENESFLLTYGDGLSDIKIDESILSHRESKKLCTISAVHPAGRFGTLSLDESNRIHEFTEKPQHEKSYVNGGFMVCSYNFFDYLPDDEGMMLERSPMTRLAAAQQLNAYRHEGFWQPMDTYQEMQYLNDLWRSGTAPWKKWS
jgi:glucose-1-phosphate cytidylyltransferase